MPLTIIKNAFKINNDNAFFNADMLLGDANLVEGYVSPEMFGAVGDGVTDDTAAWQSAVDSGKNVRAHSKKYKCGQINVTKNITIDCNYAEFTCIENGLFYCHGTVKNTLTGQNAYTANTGNYSITSEQFSDYTGMGMLQGTNNFEQTRAYYRGGFTCTFHDGEMDGVFPIDVSGSVSILLIDPITVTLEKIGNIVYQGSDASNKNWIRIEYGLDCIVRDLKTVVSNFYTLIDLNKCLNCTCEQMQISGEMGMTGTNSYLVGFTDSSECAVYRSHMYNKYWHCITTGGTYLCYNNTVSDCFLGGLSGGAFVDHPNGIKSTLRNCTVSMIGIGGLGVVDNCSVYAHNNTNALNIFPTTSPLLSGAIVKDTLIYANNTRSITIRSNPYENDITYYIKGMYFSNVRHIDKTKTLNLLYAINSVISDKNAYFVIGDITVMDVDATIDFEIDSPNVDRTNEKIIIRNGV